MNTNIIVRPLHSDDCTPDLLSSFSRYQEVARCWRIKNSEWVLEDISYTKQWGNRKKRFVIGDMRTCLQNGGRAVGAFEDGVLIGFAWILAEPFGSLSRYVNLDMMHTSHERRGYGVGRRMFDAICDQARELGAEKLYISSHSAEDTMAFYRKVGCVDALEINQTLAENEPLDCQLEYTL